MFAGQDIYFPGILAVPSVCVCDFTCAAVACVRPEWMLAPEAVAGAGTWLRDHHCGVCTHDLVPLGRVRMSLAGSAGCRREGF